MTDINGIHHVGHVVRDLDAAVGRYETLGFALPEPVHAFGVASSRAYLKNSFIELLSVGAGAVDAPEGLIRDAIARLTAGMSIVIFNSTDIDASAARLDAAGIAHTGVVDIKRPITTDSGTRMVPARFLEFEGTAEGRVGIAQNSTVDDPGVAHPNGALDVIGVTLHAPDPAAAEARYATYVGGDPTRLVTFAAGPSPSFAGYTVALPDMEITVSPRA